MSVKPQRLGEPGTLIRQGESDVTLRRASPVAPRAVAIAASTGGPQALAAVLQKIAPAADLVPIYVVLHMPNDFAPVVSGYLERLTGRRTLIARHGDVATPGRVYIAPGNAHLQLMRGTSHPSLIHSDGPPENFCKPAADVLFRSAAKVYGPALLGVVLSGMGADGLAGSKTIVDAGGSVVVQDADSSAVWGMPGAVAKAGLACAIMPADEIGQMAAQLIRYAPRGAIA